MARGSRLFLALALSITASIYVLMPKSAVTFSLKGAAVYEGLYAFADDMPEVHRRLAYDLDRFWETNDRVMRRLVRGFRIAALALAAEVILLVTGTLS